MNTADAAKNALESFFNKTKEVVQTAAETTKTYANQAIGKIIPGQQSNAPATAAGAGSHSVAGAPPTVSAPTSVPPTATDDAMKAGKP